MDISNCMYTNDHYLIFDFKFCMMLTGSISIQGYKYLPFFFSFAHLLSFSFCQWQGVLERVWKVGGGRRAFFPCVFGVVLSMFFQQWHFTSAAEVGSFWLPTSFHTPRISLVVLTWRHHSTRAVFSSQQTVLALGSLVQIFQCFASSSQWNSVFDSQLHGFFLCVPKA